jgi:putative protein-disulfide isomerase
MLPELLAVRSSLGDRLDFKLRCAGLQVGSLAPLSEARAAQLIELWQHVAETTGQQFAFQLPDDATFIYHSELACRALQICRDAIGMEPWDIFRSIQEAFYVDCRNIGDLDVLYDLASETGISRNRFLALMTDERIVTSTHDEFDWCHSQGSDALPTVWLDTGDGMTLVCGGYATADYLIPELERRLITH